MGSGTVGHVIDLVPVTDRQQSVGTCHAPVFYGAAAQGQSSRGQLEGPGGTISVCSLPVVQSVPVRVQRSAVGESGPAHPLETGQRTVNECQKC